MHIESPMNHGSSAMIWINPRSRTASTIKFCHQKPPARRWEDMNTRRLLHVSEQASEEVAPVAANLDIILTSDSFFSGRAAFEKATELKQLTRALAARDIPLDAVSLQGASMQVETGIFTRSSHVTYRVRIHVKNVERVADALDAIAESKKATLYSTTWDYGDGVPPALLARCTKNAMTKAAAMAEALGVEIDNVHEIREDGVGGAPEYPVAPMSYSGLPGGAGAMKGRASIASEVGDLELAPRRKVTVKVTLQLEVSGRPR